MAGVFGKGDRVTRWWWIRHAPVRVNNGCVYGQDDLPCDTSDAASFSALARLLPREAVWVVSNLCRTHQTAAAITAAGLPGPAEFPGKGVTVIPEFAEQCFGEWQGRTYASLAERTPEEYHRFWLLPAYNRPPGGESFQDMVSRVHPQIHRLTQEHSGRDIIAVAHGGTIRAALGLALDLSADKALAFSTDNLGVTRLDHYPAEEGETSDSWRVSFMNRAAR